MNEMTSINKNVLFMAVAKGNASTEGAVIKRYIGIAPCKIVAINPTKAQIKDLMGYEPTEEPAYTGVQEVDGKQVAYARVSVIIRTDAEKCGIDTTQRMDFFIRNQYRQGSQSGKYQVLDAYNNYAWGTEEAIKAKEQIVYSNGPAKLIGAYRPAYFGEWELMNLIRQYLCIGSSGETNGFDYINGTWVEKKGDELKDCECSFSVEEIQKMFKGDFSPVKEAIDLQPNNTIKVLFGIRTADDGKEYQDVYVRTVLRNNATSVAKLQKEIEDAQNAGGLTNRIYEFCDIKEYTPTPTNFNNAAPAEADPFAASATPW